MADVQMRVLLSAIGGAGVLNVIGSVSSALGKGGLAGTLATVGVAAAGMAIAMGVDAVKSAGDFESQTERLVTSAGELQTNLDMVRQGMLKMSVDTATSTQQLSAGMYYVESSGYHAAAGLQVLQTAAEGAKSENADLDVVTKALTTEMVDYHLQANQSTDAMNGLIAAVSNGKTNLQELSSSMGAVLPIASSLHISFAQVAGSMDTMTNAGMSSRQAAMNLAHVLLALSSPSGIAVKSMAGVGLSAQEVKDALVHKGLPEALQMIEDAVGKRFPAGSVAYETAVKNITGGITGFKLAAMLTGKSLEETKSNIEKVSEAMKNGHGAVSGWSEVQGTFNFKWQQFQMFLQAGAIQLGTNLLPLVTNAITDIMNFSTWVGNVTGAFGNWWQKSKDVQTVLNDVKDAINTAITTVQNITGAIGDWWNKADLIHKALDALHDAVSRAKDIINGTIDVVKNIVNWFIQWHTPILAVSGAITLFFLPAIIKAGVEAAVSGAKIGASFVSSLAQSGTAAVINGVKVSAQFVASMAKAGVEAVVNGAKVTAQFVASMAKAGTEAVINGAKVTASFVSSLIKTGVEGWTAAGKLGVVIGQFIATGVQAVIAGTKIAAQFVANIVKAGVEAVITAGKFVASLIPAIVSMTAQAIVAAATAIPGLVIGFIAWTGAAFGAAAATIAATWPILLVVAVIALIIAAIVLLVTHWKQASAFALMIWGHIVKFFQDDVAKPVGNLFNQIGTTIHNALQGAQQAFEGFKTAVLGVWNGIVGGIKSAINWIIDQINNFIKGINSLGVDIGPVHIHTHIPLIPHLATGGVLTSPGFVRVGEFGAETVALPAGAAVYPHGSVPAGAGGGNTYVFNVALSTIASTQSEMARVVDLFEQEIARRFRTATPSYAASNIF